MRIVMIGQAPGRNAGENPQPCEGKWFQRLARVAGGAEKGEEDAFLEQFERVNLIETFPGAADRRKGDVFPRKRAKERAQELKPAIEGRIVLLMGKNVAGAFGLRKLPPLTWDTESGPWKRAAVVPHPSGVNLWWNKEENRAAARRFFMSLA